MSRNRERTGFVFNPLHERSFYKRLTPLAVSKKIVDIGEKANIIVSEKGNRDRETGELKPRYASAHDLRRAFGFRWSRRVKAFELKELMRHENIATTQEYYLEENAQDTARSIWDSCEVNRRSSLRSSTPNSDKQGNEASSKVLPDKK